jgi:predicted nuclease with TOPRIM domain
MTTQESEWELRDGKFYKKITNTLDIETKQPEPCRNCPTYKEKITVLTKEVTKLQSIISERDRTIKELKIRIETLEREQKTWLELRTRLETVIKEREALIVELRSKIGQETNTTMIIKEKETLSIRIREIEKQLHERDSIIAKMKLDLQKLPEKDKFIFMLQQRIKMLEERCKKLEEDGKKPSEDLIARLKEKDAELAAARKRISELEILLENLRIQVRSGEEEISRLEALITELQKAPPVPAVKPEPRIEAVHWYYAVQDPASAEHFQMHPRYCGGGIVVESLEGSTVLDPNLHLQVEEVAGNSKLRVRVVDGNGFLPSSVSSEVFIRLRLGEVPQFTQPLPVSGTHLAWHQEFVFVAVHLKNHHVVPAFSCSVYPLVVQIVERQIGTANEKVVGEKTIDLTDLVIKLTRVIQIPTVSGGSVQIRIKALDFGLPQAFEPPR